MSEQLENQKGAKSHIQNTVYLPLGKVAGIVTYPSVCSASCTYGRQEAKVVKLDISGSNA
jgi:hypothetical protein